ILLRHSDHGERLAIERNLLADDVQLPTKALLPIWVSEDNHGIGIHVLSFLRQKQTTGRRLHTEHAEEVSGDVVSHEPVCPATGADACDADLISRETAEDARVRTSDLAV